MAFNLKLFDTMGMITLVTPPSMINPGDISFLLIDLKEDQKNQFATQLNTLFPDDDITVFIFDSIQGKGGWINQASQRARFIVVDKTNLPIFIDEMLPDNKVYEYNADNSVQSIFEQIKQTHFKE